MATHSYKCSAHFMTIEHSQQCSNYMSTSCWLM